MSEQKISGKDLLAAGWQPGPVMGTALEVAETLLADQRTVAEVITLLDQVRQDPVPYQNDPPVWDPGATNDKA